MNKYDRVIQENILALGYTVTREILGLVDVDITHLPRKMQHTLEREADMVFKATYMDGRQEIYNVEWQTANDKWMPQRMALQHLILQKKYKLPVRGVVIYTGAEKLTMPDTLVNGSMSYTYDIIDLSDYDPRIFLQTEDPDKLMMALLAGKANGEERRPEIRELLLKLHGLLTDDPEKLSQILAQLEILSEMKALQQIFIEEETHMPIKLDPHKSIRFQQGRKYGLEEGLERGLKKGRQQTSMEKDMTFVTNLLHSTDFSADKIARLAGVTVSFVEKIKSKLA